ncbi:MAG: hypothetical protein AAF184_24535 [Pseudomonadota bacterium]
MRFIPPTHLSVWLSAAIILLTTGAVVAEEGQDFTLVGRWDVSLHYSPDKPPSKTELVVTAMVDGKLEGSFYGSPFSESGYTVHRGTLLFTAVTADGTGPYLHSARQVGECLEGQTLSTGRGFLMAWTACRS